MDVDRRADRPLYLQLAGVLRAQIHDGRFSPGERLPSESTLITEHDVSRGTVRDAIGVLRSEGLVVVEHGRGAYVRSETSVAYLRHLGGHPGITLVDAFTADAAAQGRHPSIRQIDPALIDGIAPPKGVAVQGVLCFADGHPIQAAITWTTTQDAADSATEQVRTRMPTRGERRLLRLDDGIPVLEVNRSTPVDGRFESSVAVLPADRTALRTAPVR